MTYKGGGSEFATVIFYTEKKTKNAKKYWISLFNSIQYTKICQPERGALS